MPVCYLHKFASYICTQKVNEVFNISCNLLENFQQLVINSFPQTEFKIGDLKMLKTAMLLYEDGCYLKINKV